MSAGGARLGEMLVDLLDELVDRRVAERLPELLGERTRAEGYIGTAEAARRAGLKQDAILAWIARGTLQATRPPSTKSWRIRPADLDAVLAGEGGGCVPAPAPVDLKTRRAERAARLLAASTRKPAQ